MAPREEAALITDVKEALKLLGEVDLQVEAGGLDTRPRRDQLHATVEDARRRLQVVAAELEGR